MPWGCRSRCSAPGSRSSPPRTCVVVVSGASASVGTSSASDSTVSPEGSSPVLAAISSSLAEIRERTSLTDATRESSVSAAFAPSSWPSWWSRCASRPRATSASFSSLFRLRSWIWIWPVLAVSWVLSTTVVATSVACCLILSRNPMRSSCCSFVGFPRRLGWRRQCERWRCIISGTPCWTWTLRWRGTRRCSAPVRAPRGRARAGGGGGVDAGRQRSHRAARGARRGHPGRAVPGEARPGDAPHRLPGGRHRAGPGGRGSRGRTS